MTEKLTESPIFFVPFDSYFSPYLGFIVLLSNFLNHLDFKIKSGLHLLK